MTILHKYFTLSGDGFLRKRAPGQNYRPLGNLPEAVIALEQETAELKSTGNVSGTLAEDVTSSSATLRIVMNSQAFENAALALQGALAEIPAGEDLAFTYPVIKAGEVVKLPHVKISNVAITGKTLGVDYSILPGGVGIQAITDNAAAIPACSYDHAAYRAIGLRTGEADEFQFLFYSTKSKRVYEVLRFKLNPGEHSLISTDFGTITLEGKLLLDETVATDASLPAEIKALGGYVRLAETA